MLNRSLARLSATSEDPRRAESRAPDLLYLHPLSLSFQNVETWCDYCTSLLLLSTDWHGGLCTWRVNREEHKEVNTPKITGKRPNTST